MFLFPVGAALVGGFIISGAGTIVDVEALG
jgi:hypothetical protein